MSTRRKLNVAYLNGALLIAGIAGFVTDSWLVFLTALVILVLGDVYARNIR